MAYNITPILRICCMLLLWLVLFPLYANADWLKVESDNFVMIGDADKSESVRLVAELEVFRQTLVQLAGASRPSEIRKIHIYASRKRRTFNPYTRVRSELIASWYEAKDDNPTIAIYWRGNGKRLRERAFFEVSRHLLHALSIRLHSLLVRNRARVLFRPIKNRRQYRDDRPASGQPHEHHSELRRMA
jgi:hypothetical protein